jgi:hypothetical protein
MGIEVEQFVHPERISSQLFCSICTNVLENPVITPSEHLFCEAELLDWFVMKGDQICPVTNMKLDPSKITKPGRIITNMLNELERYCTNKCEGCPWTGENCQLQIHLKTCHFKPRAELQEEIQQKSTTVQLLKSRVSVLEERVQTLEDDRTRLRNTIGSLERRLHVYEAFFKERDEDLPDTRQQQERIGNNRRNKEKKISGDDEEEDSALLLSLVPAKK